MREPARRMGARKSSDGNVVARDKIAGFPRHGKYTGDIPTSTVSIGDLTIKPAVLDLP